MNQSFPAQEPERFASAIRRFDEENRRDPHTVVIDGSPQPYELVYSRWLSDWVLRLCPNASEPLRLAARCQHLCRWEIPRTSYPLTRAGYLQWREELKRFHAKKAGEILREVGYPEELVQRVQSLNLKKNLAQDSEVQVLEDALCLVFLEHQLAELAEKSTREKVINAVQKSWKKMRPAARDVALQLSYSPEEKALLEAALQPQL